MDMGALLHSFVEDDDEIVATIETYNNKLKFSIPTPSSQEKSIYENGKRNFNRDNVPATVAKSIGRMITIVR